MIAPLIVYLHGANSTPRSFNHIVNELPQHSAQLMEYSNDRPIMDEVKRFSRVFAEIREKGSTRPINLVGHSLGGVVAVALAQRFDLCGGRVATISAPFGGSNVAALMRWMMPCQLFDDIHPTSPLMNAVRSGGKVAQTMSIVSTAGGSNLLSEENDGVVSVSSQTALPWPSYVRVRVNHFESLLCDDVLDLLDGHFFQD